MVIMILGKLSGFGDKIDYDDDYLRYLEGFRFRADKRHEVHHRMGAKYGLIFQETLPGMKFVIIADPEEYRESFFHPFIGKCLFLPMRKMYIHACFSHPFDNYFILIVRFIQFVPYLFE